jgi:hypothetical protein
MLVINLPNTKRFFPHAIEDILQKKLVLFTKYASVLDKNKCDLNNGFAHMNAEEKKHLPHSSVDSTPAIAEIREILQAAQKFADERHFYKLHDAVSHAFSKIDTFEERHHCRCQLPLEVNETLRECVDVYTATSQVLTNSMKDLHDLLQYNSESKTEDLERWARSIEKFGDALEDNVEFFSIDKLKAIQEMFFEVIEKTQKKSPSTQTRKDGSDTYRIRVRNAAGFITKLIDYQVEAADAEESEILEAIQKANYPLPLNYDPEKEEF